MGNKVLPQLCSDKTCVGCMSCVNSCNQSALRIMQNEEGFYRPSLDIDKCIGCHMCAKSCPILIAKDLPTIKPSAFGCYSQSDSIRYNSSSGGAFSSIAINLLSENGIVWGAGYDENMRLVYMPIERIEDLDKIRRSKYVQCFVGDAYKRIKKQLKDGKPVLFCGTPCHVAGLYGYLGNSPENLLTIDFICHGVPSPLLFSNYLKWISEKYQDKVVDYKFRDKKFGVNYNVATTITLSKLGEKHLYGKENSYTLGFCKGKTICASCYNCHFRSTQRLSDFTIGDFHGNTYSGEQKFKGVSCLIANSDKAKDIVKSLDQIIIQEVSLETIVKSNPSYTQANSGLPNENLKEMVKESFSVLSESVLKMNLKDKLRMILMKLFGTKVLYRLLK